MTPPVAEQIPTKVEMHGKEHIDEFAWMRDPKWPDVKDKKIIDYLKEENQYFENFFKPLEMEKKKIFDELKGRIKLTDQSPYVKPDQYDYYYYTRTEEDKNYPIYCRKKVSTILNSVDVDTRNQEPTPMVLARASHDVGNVKSIDYAPEEILLDVNKLAEGKSYTSLGALSVSPDHKLIAYSTDFTGAERYNVRIFNIETKEYFTDEIIGTIGDLVWHEDENMKGFFYTPVNDNWRHDKIFFHKLGDAQSDDKLVFHEPNILYNVSVDKSSSHKYIFINVNGHDTNEIYVIPMSDHTLSPVLFRAKEPQIYYSIDHNGDYFYINTNYEAKNYKIARASTKNFASVPWEDYISEDENYLSSFGITQKYLTLNYLQKGIPLLKVLDLSNKETKTINFPDPAFVASVYSTNFEDNDIRVDYASLARPSTVYSYDYAKGDLTILKVKEIPSGFNIDDYTVEREWANNNGVKVPISILYKKSLFKKDGTNPLYLYGYGSYGYSIGPGFMSKAVSLVNNGFVFAIAHIRGGDDLGQDWYEDAKFLNKKRTFEDFIKSAEHLIDKKYTSFGNIAIVGGSAGGMLVGAVVNERPDLFKAVVAHVPFVDVLNTMLDETLPLTPSEYKEWGNPKDPEYYDYIKSYSPYDNIKAQNYPNIMVTAALSDPRVGYWEAAKWVARLRATKTDKNIILLKINLDAGHKGASGRFDYLKEQAEELLFIYKMFKVSN